MRIVSVGNAIVDLVMRVPALPVPGGDVLAVSGGSTPGGAINVLIAARRQGSPSAYAGGHGTGPMGDLVRDVLAAEQIEVLQEKSPGWDTGMTIALTDDTGERTFVTAFGAEARLAALPALDRDDVLHVSGYGVLADTNAGVVVPWLRGAGAGTVLFDPGPLVGDIRAADLAVVRERTDWLSCNERESGRVGEGWRHTVVRLGADGCLVDGEHVPGFRAEVVDTNGAGDAHVGVFLAGLAAGLEPVAAARRANAAASIAVSRPGPTASPTAAEVDALLN